MVPESASVSQILHLTAKPCLHLLHYNWHKHYSPEITYPRGHKTRCVQRFFEVNLDVEYKMVYESLNTSGKKRRKEFE